MKLPFCKFPVARPLRQQDALRLLYHKCYTHIAYPRVPAVVMYNSLSFGAGRLRGIYRWHGRVFK